MRTYTRMYTCTYLHTYVHTYVQAPSFQASGLQSASAGCAKRKQFPGWVPIPKTPLEVHIEPQLEEKSKLRPKPTIMGVAVAVFAAIGANVGAGNDNGFPCDLLQFFVF